MFKILSGAASDKRRYEMLNKIGTRPQILRRSIIQEVGVLFALPGILGVIDVLFGLQMFRGLLLSLMTNSGYHLHCSYFCILFTTLSQ